MPLDNAEVACPPVRPMLVRCNSDPRDCVTIAQVPDGVSLEFFFREHRPDPVVLNAEQTEALRDAVRDDGTTRFGNLHYEEEAFWFRGEGSVLLNDAAQRRVVLALNAALATHAPRPAPTFVPTMPEAGPCDRAAVLASVDTLRRLYATLAPVVAETHLATFERALTTLELAVL